MTFNHHARHLLGALCAALLLSAAPALASAQAAATSESTESAPIDLNSASAEQLASLPGIGPSKAAAIVSFRERRPFRRVEDILRVRGIGRATFRSIRDRIHVNESRRQR